MSRIDWRCVCCLLDKRLYLFFPSLKLDKRLMEPPPNPPASGMYPWRRLRQMVADQRLAVSVRGSSSQQLVAFELISGDVEVQVQPWQWQCGYRFQPWQRNCPLLLFFFLDQLPFAGAESILLEGRLPGYADTVMMFGVGLNARVTQQVRCHDFGYDLVQTTKRYFLRLKCLSFSLFEKTIRSIYKKIY